MLSLLHGTLTSPVNYFHVLYKLFSKYKFPLSFTLFDSMKRVELMLAYKRTMNDITLTERVLGSDKLRNRNTRSNK